MIFSKNIIPKSEIKTEAEAIKDIRDHFLFFGLNLYEYTDDQIKEGVILFSKFATQAGYSANQAAEGLIMLGKLGNPTGD